MDDEIAHALTDAEQFALTV
jgi:hypothetical protein